jgi:hypothetical protein
MVFDRLAALNHSRIAWFSLVDINSPLHKQYQAGNGPQSNEYRVGTRNGPRHGAWANLATCQPDLEPMPVVVEMRDWERDSLGDAVRRGLDRILTLKPRPTAIVVGSDNMGLEVLEQLRERGIDVPGEISVVGYGAFPQGLSCDPTLASVVIPMEKLGLAVPEIIQRRRADPNAVPISILFDADFRDGGSLGPSPVNAG